MSKSANNRLILALIGAGGRGTSVILGLQQCRPDVEVKYVCDVDASRGGRAVSELEKKQGYAPVRIEDMKKAFDDKDVDAVVICTPEHWHALAAIRACQAGKHVYVEKNISLNMHEGRKMIEASRKYNRLIQCGTQNRSGAYAFSARDYISDGRLGTIVHVKNFCILPGSKPQMLKEDSPAPEGLNWDLWLGPAKEVPYNVSRHKAWYDWWDYSGGYSLAGDASHVMDLARMVIGDPGHPQSVYCAGGRILYEDNRDIPDIQVITYDYTDFSMTCESANFGHTLTKTKGEIRYGNAFPDWGTNSTRIEIYGTEGLMCLGRHGGGWQVFGDGGEVVAEEFGYFPDELHQQDFIDSLRDGKTPNANIEQGHLSASLVHFANLSYRVGEQQLDIDPKTGAILNSPEAMQIDMGTYRPDFELPEVI